MRSHPSYRAHSADGRCRYCKVRWRSAAAVGGPAVLSRLIRAAFPDQKERLRAEIERKADLLAKLPDDSTGHKTLLTSIEEDLRRLVIDLDEARRDPMSIGLGIAFIALAFAAGA